MNFFWPFSRSKPRAKSITSSRDLNDLLRLLKMSLSGDASANCELRALGMTVHYEPGGCIVSYSGELTDMERKDIQAVMQGLAR